MHKHTGSVDVNTNLNRAIIKRELKIDDNANENRNFNEVEEYLKTVSKKFMKDPLSIENLDKVYNDMVAKNKNDKGEQSLVEMRSKSKKHEEKAIFYDIFIKPKENKIKEIRLKRNEQKGASDFNARDGISGTNSSVHNVKEKQNIQTSDKAKKMFISNKTTEAPSKSSVNILNNNDFKQNATDVNSLLNSSSEMNSQLSANNKSSTSNVLSNINYEKVNREMIKTNLSSELKPELISEYSDILYKYLQDKFIPTDNTSESKKNFFNQLIQIRPPEGINAVAASPLVETNKGWAPSIPSLQISKMKTNLNDLMMRAKGGIQAGDIPKEAHMAFFLGIMNEEERRYEEALKFYKKYFLSAKLLQDAYGTELALNRIAVLYSNIMDYHQSLYYNEKHKDISTHNLNGFVAYYNCGVCHRILGRLEDSIKSFNQALQMADQENDLESYTICLSQLALSYIFTGNLRGFYEYGNEFFNKNRVLKNKEMDLEMLLVSGYISNFCGHLDNAKEFYTTSLKQSKSVDNEYYKALSLCNIGIIEANKDFEDFMTSLAGHEN